MAAVIDIFNEFVSLDSCPIYQPLFHAAPLIGITENCLLHRHAPCKLLIFSQQEKYIVILGYDWQLLCTKPAEDTCIFEIYSGTDHH